jgi:C-5 cytosine-specific DNA methylase
MTAGPTTRKFTVLDLFSGCGGFSLGFSRAAFDIVGGIEIDPDAERTHSMHFSRKVQPNRPCDIQQVDSDEVTQPLSSLFAGQRTKIDVIIGGPPCQPFTRVGRAKLREVAGNVYAHVNDRRAPFFTNFLRFVAGLRPLAHLLRPGLAIGYSKVSLSSAASSDRTTYLPPVLTSVNFLWSELTLSSGPVKGRMTAFLPSPLRKTAY